MMLSMRMSMMMKISKSVTNYDDNEDGVDEDGGFHKYESILMIMMRRRRIIIMMMTRLKMSGMMMKINMIVMLILLTNLECLILLSFLGGKDIN